MTTWYTSDLHFGHRFVSELRGFGDDTVAHDLAIMGQWTSQVREDDVVYVLGDLAVSNPINAINLVGNLRGRKYLIAGNHDRCHPMHRDAFRRESPYLYVFESVSPFGRRRIAGQSVLLSHFPYTGDRGPDRFTQYRLPDEGEWLLHGHTHGKERRVGKMIHVGWDAWGRLVSQEEIEQIIVEATDVA